MNDWHRKNCGICEHKKNPDGGYCFMFKAEPDDYCRQVKIAEPLNGRPAMVPFPPVQPVS